MAAVAAPSALMRVLGLLGGGGGGNKLQNVAGNVQALETVTNKLGGAAKTLSSPLQLLTDTFGSMQAAVSGLGRSVAEFVQFSNPGAVKLWEFAMRDAMAAIGHAIGPVMEFATVVQRAFGDVVARAAGPISAALNGALKPFAEILPKLVNASQPLINIFTQMITSVARFGEFLAKALDSKTIENLGVAFEVLEVAAKPFIAILEGLAVGFAKLIDWGLQFNSWVVKTLGISTRRPSADRISGESVGLAATNAKIGSQESFITEAFTRAFQMGRGVEVGRETLSAVQEIEKWLTKELPGKVKEWIKELATEIARFLPGSETLGLVSAPVDRTGADTERGGALLRELIEAASGRTDRLEAGTAESRPRPWPFR